MANPELETFLKQVKGDPALLQRFSACPNLNAIAELGGKHGFSFSGVDLVKHQAEATLRLSDHELEAAAAGVELEGHLWLMKIVWS
ncbi:MAG: Nif11-like leader peptide family RiPP precursor [Cyanobacteriota bacterium]|jgi:predicted ribosomally synthesized peptide with nif11-like leader|nr:Nif11-like leader peptide family RiPP precursor [Cyanobacteriota bacterium]